MSVGFGESRITFFLVFISLTEVRDLVDYHINFTTIAFVVPSTEP
jgi:hypothetical protein